MCLKLFVFFVLAVGLTLAIQIVVESFHEEAWAMFSRPVKIMMRFVLVGLAACGSDPLLPIVTRADPSASPGDTDANSNDTPQCGNGIAELGESCDGDDLRDITCSQLMFTSGTPGCVPSGSAAPCTLDLSGCYNEPSSDPDTDSPPDPACTPTSSQWLADAWGACEINACVHTRSVSCIDSCGVDHGDQADELGCSVAIRPASSERCPGQNSCCVSSAGQSCDRGHFEELVGCEQDTYGCAAFVGIYYNSPNGCDPSTAGGWVEYMFDGSHELSRSGNNAGEWAIVGDTSSPYHCTYVGFSETDSFHNTPDGSCINSTALGYSIPDTYTRVVAGTGCTHKEWVAVPGTYQCDGSCL